MALIDIESRVEKSIFEIIRLKLVAEGYLPNKKSFAKSDAGAAAYQAAITAIKDSNKKFCIQVFGMASPQARGETQVPRIVVQTQRALPGDLGTPITTKEVNGDHYEKFKHPYTSANLQVDIKIVWNTANQLRIASAIIASTLSTRNYIDFYDTPGNENKIYLEQLNAGYDIRDIEQGVTETIIQYQIKDLYTVADALIIANGPLITEIKTEIKDLTNNIETIITN
jgi:hypothetical protein